jgi:hypothetical protein
MLFLVRFNDSKFIDMQKSIVFIIVLVFSLSFHAQDKSAENEVKKVIETFFEGLHKGDSTLMASTLHKDVKIQTTSSMRGPNGLLQTDSRAKLLTAIANKNPEHVYLEKLLSYTIKIDGNIASVWTPYEFYFNNNFSHCGANSFQLFKNEINWKIIYLVDMRRRDKCQALKEKK